MRRRRSGHAGVAACALAFSLIVVREVGAEVPSVASENASLRPFTVADSIEMTRLIEPDVAMARYVPAEFKFSPNGRHFVIVTRKGNFATGENDYALIVHDTASVVTFVNADGNGVFPKGRALLRLSSSSNDDPVREIRWLADGKMLGFLGAINATSPQVYSLDSVTGGTLQLTHHSRPVERFDLNVDTDRVILASTVPSYPEGRGKTSYVVGNRNLYETLYLDAELPMSRYQYYAALKGSKTPARPLGATFQSQFPNVWLSPDGRRAIGVQSPEQVPSHWTRNYIPFTRDWYFREIAETFDAETMSAQEIVHQFVLIDLVNGSVKPVVDAPNGIFLGGGSRPDVLWLPDGSSVILASTFLPLDVADVAERERRKRAPAIVEFDLSTAQTRRVTELNQSAQGEERGRFVGMTRLADGSLRVTWRSSDGALSSRFFRKRNGAWKELPLGDDQAASHTRGSRLALSIRQDLNTAPEILARDLASGRQRLITDFNPQFRRLQLGSAEPLEWSDSTGRSWLGGLVFPPDFRRGARCPLVIQTYGFHAEEFLLDGPILAFSSAFAARALANRGMLVLQMPLPSQARSGPPIADGTPEEIEAARFATESAIDKLDAMGFIDPQRVGIIGFSRTGLYVQNLITFSNHNFAAATVAESFHVSLLDYIGKFGTGNPGMLEMERLVDAKPWGTELDEWVARDPVLHLDRVRTPLRLEHYRSRGLFGWWDTYAILKRLHRPVEFVQMPDGAHNLVKPRQRLASLQGNVDWFAFWLKGEEDPDPAKAEQYARWRKLRTQHEAAERGRAAPGSASTRP